MQLNFSTQKLNARLLLSLIKFGERAMQDYLISPENSESGARYFHSLCYTCVLYSHMQNVNAVSFNGWSSNGFDV